MPIARLLSTEGPYLEAEIEVDGVCLRVMDEFSVDSRSMPKIGAEFEFEFSPCLDEDESWECIFSENPGKKTGLVNLGGWRYRAYGRIISIHPVVADCGVASFVDVIHTNDPRILGEFIAFTISRLGVCAFAT